METTKRLVDLPIEVLLHIFDYIPSRWNLSLVCWNFYEIICEIEKENFAMKLIDVSLMQEKLGKTKKEKTSST